MNKIICHIVGMNAYIKKEFSHFIISNYPDIIIIDLDDITDKIRNERKITKMCKDIINVDKKSEKYVELKKDIDKYWKQKIDDKLEKIIKDNNNIVFIGLSTFHRNHKISANIETNNKFFLRIDKRVNTQNIIENNLDKYKDYIIKGKFPLRYLDYKFLLDQRERLIDIYCTMEYKMKTLKDIYKWFYDSQKDDTITDDNNIIYVGSHKKYDNYLGKIKENSWKNIRKNKRRQKNNISELLNDISNESNAATYEGYTKKWLALLSSIPNMKKHIIRGHLEFGEKSIPFIEERKKKSFNILNKEVYLYSIDKDNFNMINWYKYESDKTDLKYNSVEHIPNLFDYFKEHKFYMIEKT